MASLTSVEETKAGLSLEPPPTSGWPGLSQKEKIVRALNNIHSGFRTMFWTDFHTLDNEENDDTYVRGINEYLSKIQSAYMFVRVRRPANSDTFVLGYMKCDCVFSFEPRYRRLHNRFRLLPSVVVNAIETDEEKEYRMECVGPTNYEVEEVKTKHPPDWRGTSLHVAAYKNDLSSVKILLRSVEFDVRVMNNYGLTAQS